MSEEKNVLEWRGPLFAYFSAFVAEWEECGGARVAARLKDEQPPGKLAFADLTALPRVGVKGGSAEDWDFLPAPPPKINGVVELPGGGRVARLGEDELLCLPSTTGEAAGEGIPDVPERLQLPRRDGLFCFGLRGETAADINGLLSRLSMLPPPAAGEVQQTRLAAFDGILLPAGKNQFYWLGESAYAVYAWYTLAAIAEKIGGAPIGWQAWKKPA